MPVNVQLSAKESVKVFVEIGSERILGFAPEFGKPLFSGSIKYREHILLHARDIEMWVARYRRQQEIDAQAATYRQIERESIFRKSLRSAILRRNQHVNQVNRDLNNVLIRLMDEKYDKMMEAKKRPQMATLAELSEASASRDNEVYDLAVSSKAYKHPGDMRATGGAVQGDLEKIEHDRHQ